MTSTHVHPCAFFKVFCHMESAYCKLSSVFFKFKVIVNGTLSSQNEYDFSRQLMEDCSE